MEYVLFVADKFSDEMRSRSDLFPGGAERTDEAAIQACPYQVKKVKWERLSEKMIKDSIVVIVGNSGDAKSKHLEMLTRFRKHVLFEHDVRICNWRGNFPVALEPIHRFSHRCCCRHAEWRPVFQSALGVIYLTKLQKKYYDDNYFFRGHGKSEILGSSLFDEEFLQYVEQKSCSTLCNEGTLVPGTSTKIKGAKQAQRFCKEKGWEFTKIRNFTPRQVWDAMSNAKRFVYLPIGLEPAGRMPVEARLLGSDVIVNEHVGVAGEEIWKLEDTEFVEAIRKQPHRFWKLVRDLSPDFAL